MARRILISGARDFKDRKLIKDVISTFPKDSIIIEGEAPGADTFARETAIELGFPEEQILKFPAEWDLFNKAAGPIRNRQMLKEGKPTEAHFFFRFAKESVGTSDMLAVVRHSKPRIPVFIYTDRGHRLLQEFKSSLIKLIGLTTEDLECECGLQYTEDNQQEHICLDFDIYTEALKLKGILEQYDSDIG